MLEGHQRRRGLRSASRVSGGTAGRALPRDVADGAEDTALARIDISQFANRARHKANPVTYLRKSEDSRGSRDALGEAPGVEGRVTTRGRHTPFGKRHSPRSSFCCPYAIGAYRTEESFLLRAIRIARCWSVRPVPTAVVLRRSTALLQVATIASPAARRYAIGEARGYRSNRNCLMRSAAGTTVNGLPVSRPSNNKMRRRRKRQKVLS
jgi:hypothetical protein